MDVSSIAASLVATQAGNLQQQIATSVMKQNIDQQRSVLQLLQPTSSPANLAPGVGGNIDISA
ncbi:MAG: YjfB family protein [Rhizobiales bacterium]|nr:YjfB family protein [Hyphomicrobiales bacterium]